MVASPETISRTVAAFRQAAALLRDCPLRRGNVIELNAAAGDELMVTADLHGNRRNFSRILQLAALDAHPRRHLLMQEVCHGGPTYPSGVGCMSHLMLEEVAELKVQYRQRFHFILSNHELAELTDFPIMKARRMLNLMFRCGLQEMYGEAADQVREAAMEFIRSLPLAVRVPGALVCHTLPAEADTRGFDRDVLQRELTAADLADGGAAFRLAWGRDYRPENAEAFARIVEANVIITGHEPCPEGYSAPNRRQVILDCCGENACYALLPLDGKPLTQQDVLERIRFLHQPPK